MIINELVCANRLKLILGKLVESAFIKGRFIQNDIIYYYTISPELFVLCTQMLDYLVLIKIKRSIFDCEYRNSLLTW